MLGYIGFIVMMLGACFLDGESIAPGIIIMVIGFAMLLTYGIKESTHDR